MVKRTQPQIPEPWEIFDEGNTEWVQDENEPNSTRHLEYIGDIKGYANDLGLDELTLLGLLAQYEEMSNDLMEETHDIREASKGEY